MEYLVILWTGVMIRLSKSWGKEYASLRSWNKFRVEFLRNKVDLLKIDKIDNDGNDDKSYKIDRIEKNLLQVKWTKRYVLITPML